MSLPVSGGSLARVQVLACGRYLRYSSIDFESQPLAYCPQLQANALNVFEPEAFVVES
jgi:hypothetical protein